ncbi:MAG: hypothetical protein AB7O26_18130 [Planctomycetaceae bacterium]
MGSSAICLIPVDPEYAPDESARTRAENRLREFVVRLGKLESQLTDQVQFIHCGGGRFISVSCPSCGQEISMDDWHDWMDHDYQDGGYRLSTHTIACCFAQHRLTELVWDPPCGFARYSLQAWDPQIESLTPEIRQELETILGTPLREFPRQA